MPDKFLIVGGCSVALIIGAFLLMGAPQEIAWRISEARRRRSRGGWIL